MPLYLSANFRWNIAHHRIRLAQHLLQLGVFRTSNLLQSSLQQAVFNVHAKTWVHVQETIIYLHGLAGTEDALLRLFQRVLDAPVWPHIVEVADVVLAAVEGRINGLWKGVNSAHEKSVFSVE